MHDVKNNGLETVRIPYKIENSFDDIDRVAVVGDVSRFDSKFIMSIYDNNTPGSPLPIVLDDPTQEDLLKRLSTTEDILRDYLHLTMSQLD